jgi:hypothetical protein
MPLRLRCIMSTLATGSSLFQSPKPNLHQQVPSEDPRSLRRHAALSKRQADQPPVVAQVIQTVEVIQVVDANGVPIAVQTNIPPPSTTLIDSATGDVIEIIDSVSSVAPPAAVLTDVPVAVPDAPAIDVPAVVSDTAGGSLAANPVTDPRPDSVLIPDVAITNVTLISTGNTSPTTALSSSATSATFATLTPPLNGTGSK